MAAYIENPDFVPNPTDVTGSVDTTGTGGPHRIQDVAPVFQFDDGYPSSGAQEVRLSEGGRTSNPQVDAVQDAAGEAELPAAPRRTRKTG